MKLVIIGSTDILGAELVKQALANVQITSIIAIAGRDTNPPQEPSGDSKLVTRAIPNTNEDWDRLNNDVSATGACIWNLGPKPSGLENRIVYHDQADYLDEIRNGEEWILRQHGAHLATPASPGGAPLRFIYVGSSQARAHRMPNQAPTLLSIQGHAEERVLNSVERLGDQLKVCVAKPGRIVRPRTGNILKEMVHTAGSWVRDGLKGDLPRIQAEKVAAALLEVAIRGRREEVLYNKDLIRIGKLALKGSEVSVTGGQAEEMTGRVEETSGQEEGTDKQAQQTVNNA